jgi:PKD repeat protein
MNAETIYTRRIMGLDKNIWLTMLVVAVLSLGLLGYKIIDNKNARPCTPFIISVTTPGTENDSVFTAGEMLLIKAIASSGVQLNWDYGDGSQEEVGSIKTHKYEKPGLYSITTSLNGRCETVKRIIVTPMRGEAKPNISAGSITGNTTAIAGTEEIYSAPVAADSYEWIIVNNPKFAPQRSATARFTFHSKGTYTIQLTLNKDREKVMTKNITVLDVPKQPGNDLDNVHRLIPNFDKPTKDQPIPSEPPVSTPTPSQPLPKQVIMPEPEKKPVKKISTALFQSYLEEVISGEKTASDFFPYLAFKSSTQVKVNDDKYAITFQQYCQRIAGDKKLTIKSVGFVFDENDNNAIQTITIKSKRWTIKKGFY